MGVELEDPKPMSQYLGADYNFRDIEMSEVGTVRTCEISMEDYFRAIVTDLIALARETLCDSDFKLKEVPTPFLDEPQHKAPVRQPWCEGPSFSVRYVNCASRREK